MREHEEDNKYFHYYNANPKDRNVDDCTFRAMSLFLGKSWEEVMRLNAENYLASGAFFNRSAGRTIGSCKISSCIQYLIEKAGASVLDAALFKGESIRHFIDHVAEDNAVYYAECRTHSTIINNRQVWDTFDCSDYIPDIILKKEG